METKEVWKVGQAYFIRTVTMYLTGKLVQLTPQELLLENAAWIADTGRFSEAMRTGTFSEVEPFSGPVIVGRGSIIDAQEWGFDLPRDAK